MPIYNLSKVPELKIKNEQDATIIEYEYFLNARNSIVTKTDELKVYRRKKIHLICLSKNILVEAEMTSPLNSIDTINLSCEGL